jgi:N6-L-threonylcarbamoyladenine synthase
MLTLGIETSCDETACAVLENGDRIRASVIASSLAKHKPFGGVVPEIASRQCLEQIDSVFRTVLRQARAKKEDLDLVAVTRGPGLVGSLLVGLAYGKAIAYELKIPLIGVNHLEGHIAANFIGKPVPRGPYVGLIVSGGHTEITYHKNGRIEVLGSTIDDAVGEAYDKTAKLLGLGYPGGPIIDRLAQKGNPVAVRFTKPKQKGRFDFSFSGIKTAVLYWVKENAKGGTREGNPRLERKQLIDLCASFQETVAGWLVEKTIEACRTKKVKTVAVGGGVSANSRLRSFLAEEAEPYGIRVLFPPFALTLDNAAMIARRGYELFRRGKRSGWDLSAHPNLPLGDN